MEEKIKVVIVGGIQYHKHELMEFLGHVIVQPGFSPTHTVAYDQNQYEQYDATSKPPIDNQKTMRDFVRSHSRKGRR